MTNPTAPSSPRDPYGPSDSSDTASERPAEPADTDAAGTGERASVDLPSEQDDTARDVEADERVNADQAGLSRSAPDPQRNGGLPPASGHSLGGEEET